MGENVRLWSKTASANSNADGSINWAENQLPSTVNNSARSMMAAEAKWLHDNDASLTSTGSANAYLLTANTTYTALEQGLTVWFKANFTNTGAATLVLTPNGASAFASKAIRVVTATGDSAISYGQIPINGHVFLQYDTAANSAAGAWILINPAYLTEGANADMLAWSKTYSGSRTVGPSASGLLHQYSTETGAFWFQTTVSADIGNTGVPFSLGLTSDYQFGGSSTTGNHAAILARTRLTSATNSSRSQSNRNYVGLIAQSVAETADGGSVGTPLGGFFGAGISATANAGATNLFDLSCCEFDLALASTASVLYNHAIGIVGFNGARGSRVDAGITISGASPHIGFSTGISFTDMNGLDPSYSGSILIGTNFIANPSTQRAAFAGIDFSKYTFSDSILKAGTIFTLQDNAIYLDCNAGGSASITMANAHLTNASLVLTSKGTGIVYVTGGFGIGGNFADPLFMDCNAGGTASISLANAHLTNASLILAAKGAGGVVITVGQFFPVASSTACASINIQPGTAPTSPLNGDLWYDGTNLKFRVGGTTKTVTLT